MGLVVVLGGLAAKLKSPKSSFGMLNGFGVVGAWKEGLGAVAGFDAGFGVVSKKPPPLNGVEVSFGGAIEDRADCIGGDCIPPKEVWRSC